jgi:hypothetical protein
MQYANERDLPYRDGDSGVKYLMRGPNIDWGLIRIPPGGHLGGHYHEQVEETFYVLAGEGLLTVNGNCIRRIPGTSSASSRATPTTSLTRQGLLWTWCSSNPRMHRRTRSTCRARPGQG